MLSDGLAYDHGYERAYGAADARRALAEARRRGTGCLCLSIGASTDAETLRRVFGSAAHATIPRAEQLSHVIGPLFRSALARLTRSAACRERSATIERRHRSALARAAVAHGRRNDARRSRATRPYYVPVANEEQVFKAAFRQGLSIVLKGPTGCGKTRFVEAMAYDLDRPLITVACHDDLTTADLVGRFLLRGGETEWVDGPLTRAVREGAICYLDEVVEARQDTTVVLHPLADHRRQLPIERLGHHARRRTRLLPGRVVQPRLPERAQGPQGLDAPADGRHRVRLPAGRRRGEDRRPRGRRSTTTRPRNWCGSARRSAGWKPADCARWRRRGCSSPPGGSSPKG